MSVLVVENLQKSFGGVRAVDGVGFSLDDGEVAALIGPNGAGKSTLFNLIDGQLAADAGQVRYLGRRLDALSTAARTRLGIGRTFQVAQAFASMTALQNAQVALEAARTPLSVGAALWHRQVDAAQALLAQVGLADRAQVAAATLAYGDLKRLEFALALATARFADARVVWIAFLATLAVGALCALAAGARLRGAPVGIALVAIVLFAVLLADAAIEKAEKVYPAGTSVATTVAVDPRPAIWRGALASAAERPLAGHGFALQILADRMREVSHDPLITHPHNLFLGQLVQTGAIGLALFVLTIAALALHHWWLVRSGDAVLARLGALGLMALTGFVVRNLTDDFFLRANAKLLFAVQGVLLGAAALRRRSLADAPRR